MQQGWICIHRKIRECFIWNEEPYDKAHAWIDLLLRANHHNKKIMVNGHIKVITRGQFHTSIALLAEQWGWSRNKVYRFLKVLETEQMITTESNKGGTSNGTTITIVNYNNYQDKGNTDGTSNGTSDDTTSETTNDTTDETSDGTQTTIYNNINNDNNDNNDNNENNIYINSPTENMNVKKDFDYQSIVDEYNTICVSFPRVTKLSDSRKKAIKARLKQYTRDDFTTMFEKAEESNFLKGGNNRNWCADFDWMIKDANMAKILDGNYDNGKSNVNSKQSSGSAYIDAIKNRFDVIDNWMPKGEE